MDNNQTFTQFTELTPAELQNISGGDWWAEFFRAFGTYALRRSEGTIKHITI